MSWISGWSSAHDQLGEKAPQNRGIVALYLALLGTLLTLIIVVLWSNIDLGLTFRRERNVAAFMLAASLLLPIHILHVVDAVRGRLADGQENSTLQGMLHGISRFTFVALPYALFALGVVFVANGYRATGIVLASSWIVLLLLKRRLSLG